MIKVKPDEITSILRNQIDQFGIEIKTNDIGNVLQVGDGIAKIYGLEACMYGELLSFGNDVYGIALNLEEDYVGCVLLGGQNEISEGDEVTRTGKTVEVPVGETLIGRVVNPLGIPLDGKGEIKAESFRPIEAPAPAVIDRKSVDSPLQTGIMAIDSMVPIGKGQRELIIGDRQTGKTAIAIDTIINQKGKNVICIYVAIGQKASTVADVINILGQMGAIEHTIVVSSTASDMPTLQYIAPYSGCAMAEELMYKGRDVLIVYDDLSKHAVAYRTMSLLLRRPPGREAYPGDVFYLHSRLLERAAKLSDELGGGSITALPIVETLAGDVSAYIPTNIISITDGQIYLESELFFAGQRPAVNVGLSVSRVGGAAQIKAMKKVAGSLRINLAQFRELEVFSQFASDLDTATSEKLQQGKSLVESLKQKQYYTIPVERQVVILYSASNGYLIDIPLKEIRRFNKELLYFINLRYDDILKSIREEGVLSEETEAKLKEALTEFKKEIFNVNEDGEG